MKWIKIFDTDVLQQDDFVKEINLENKKFCAIKSADGIVITQAYCPHAGGGLSGGLCANGKLICPIHKYEYDLKTGNGAIGQGDCIDIYPVEIRIDGVYLQMPEP